jgi:hypothetical protein
LTVRNAEFGTLGSCSLSLRELRSNRELR